MTKKIYMGGKHSDRFVLVSDHRYEDLIRFSWYAKEDKDRNTWYAVTNMLVDGKPRKVKMHRYIMGVTNPKVHVDHINHNGWDNRDENLRIATNTENRWNTTKRKGSVSQYKGVSRHNNAWRARIKVNGEEIHLGDFRSPRDGALAYDHAARKYFGEFACLNFPDIVLTDEEVLAMTRKGRATSKYIGVSWDEDRGKWESKLTHNYKTIHAGRFDNETTAAIARDIAVFKLKGANAKFNFPDLFNSNTITWEKVDSDPQLRQLYRRTG